MSAELGGIMQALKDADPADKAGLYRRIELTLTYHPQEKRGAAEARPNSIMYAGACPDDGSGGCSLPRGLAGGFRRLLRRTGTVAGGTSVCRGRGRPLERAPGGPGEQRGERQFGEARHGQRL